MSAPRKGAVEWLFLAVWFAASTPSADLCVGADGQEGIGIRRRRSASAAVDSERATGPRRGTIVGAGRGPAGY